MANNKLFQELNLSHKPKRNGYDLSQRVNFTAKAGELLPLFHRTMMPGDNFKIKVSHFTRTAPLDTAAASQIREYFDFFFVPYRLLWKNAPQVHTNNLENSVSAESPISNLAVGTQTPHFSYGQYKLASGGILAKLNSSVNQFGYSRGAMSAKLMNHLGFPYLSIENIKDPSTIKYTGPDKLSIYPLLAYQCIFYNFFRNTQWEDNVPYNYNVDYMANDALFSPNVGSSDWTNYWNNPTLFDLQYSNYPKDLFFGVFPDAQFGDEAVVDVDGSTLLPTGRVAVRDSSGNTTGVIANSPDTGLSINLTKSSASPSINSGFLYTLSSTSQIDANFGILELRKATFLQKYKEIVGSGKRDYKALIQKVFGVSVPDTLAGIPTYLGGSSSTIKISEVLNNNFAGDPTAQEYQATIKGKGAGSGESDTISYEAKEHGIIMCIYHAQPVIDYSLTALHFDLVKTEYDDYANPIFDQLGFQELPFYFLTTGFNNLNIPDTNSIGYTTRYFDYKTSIDMTLGDFRETSNTWLTPLNMDYLTDFFVGTTSGGGLRINSNFFRVNPKILDPIFAYSVDPTKNDEANFVSYDQLKVFSNFEVSAVRPLDYNGVPY